MQNTHKKGIIKIIDWVFFAGLLAAEFAVSFVLFHRQACADETTFVYFSDMVVYVREMLGTETACVFPYQVFFKLGAFINLFSSTPEIAMAVTTALLNALAILFTKWFLNHFCFNGTWFGREEGCSTALPVKGDVRELLLRLLISCLTLALFFCSMVFPPSGIHLPGIKGQYMGIFTGTPWHNGTYLAARPFAVLVFFWNIRMLARYETKKIPWYEYVIFSGILFLCVMTKPSFMVVHLGATGLVMVYRLFRTKWKNFLPTLYLALCYLPVFGGMAYQYWIVYVGEVETAGEGGMALGIAKVWSYYCDNIPLAIVLAAGFPLLVLVLHLKDLVRDKLFCHSWQLYGMGLAMNFFLYEKGHKFYDFNYCWGYMYGIFFAFLGSILVLIKDTVRIFSVGEENKAGNPFLSMEARPKWVQILLVCLEYVALAAHFVCGVYFFYKLLGGAKYD